MAAETASEREHPKESQRRAAHAPDATVQSLMSRPYGGLSPIALALAHADWALHWMASPGRQAVLAQRAVELGSQAWQNVVADAMGASEETPDKDGRFADPSWRSWPYSAIKEGYKALDAWWREAAQHGGGVSRHHQHMVSFFTGQTLDALSPSN